MAALANALTINTAAPPTAEVQALASVAGEQAAERAVSVVATFQMMNRALDGVGAPIRAALRPIAEELGFQWDSIPRERPGG